MQKNHSYAQNGYQIFRNKSNDEYLHDLKEFRLKIEGDIRKKKHISGFEGEDGNAKQYIDVFSCYKEYIYQLINASEIKKVADDYYGKRSYGIITHCKLSLKTPNKKSQWYCHQDNAYKPNMGESQRSGFALMI